MDKLIIKGKPSKMSKDTVIRVDGCSNALLDELVAKTGRSKAAIANKLIKFAYEHVEVVYNDDDDEDSE
ncbi:hypothetical protein [uncultured Ruminococcus sp.]|uniref:hypothetical protein n=1 Tax=uncultured Ruminococcus sp. TaxID=165186 RepID=UPI002624B93D|nr:hypothetical protein [uncultured Ruminococcus sp.]